MFKYKNINNFFNYYNQKSYNYFLCLTNTPVPQNFLFNSFCKSLDLLLIKLLFIGVNILNLSLTIYKSYIDN